MALGAARRPQSLLENARFLEGGDAVVGIASVLQLVYFDLERIARQRRGHVVVLADAEVE